LYLALLIAAVKWLLNDKVNPHLTAYTLFKTLRQVFRFHESANNTSNSQTVQLRPAQTDKTEHYSQPKFCISR